MPIMIQINAADEDELCRMLTVLTGGLSVAKHPTDAELDARSKEWALSVNATPKPEPEPEPEPVRELTQAEKRMINMKKAQEALKRRREEAVEAAKAAAAKRGEKANAVAVGRRPRGRPRKEVQLAHAKPVETINGIDPDFDLQHDIENPEAGDDNVVLDNVMERDGSEDAALQEKLFSEALSQLQRLWADPAGAPHVRTLMHRMGVVKFGELNHTQGRELLGEVRKIQSMLTPRAR